MLSELPNKLCSVRNSKNRRFLVFIGSNLACGFVLLKSIKP